MTCAAALSPSSPLEPLYLFDGTLSFLRALHGLPDVFTNPRGRSVNGVRGFLPFLLGALIARFGSLEGLYADASAWPEAGVGPGSRLAQTLAGPAQRWLARWRGPAPRGGEAAVHG